MLFRGYGKAILANGGTRKSPSETCHPADEPVFLLSSATRIVVLLADVGPTRGRLWDTRNKTRRPKTDGLGTRNGS
jgi:hypothetical protein